MREDQDFFKRAIESLLGEIERDFPELVFEFNTDFLQAAEDESPAFSPFEIVVKPEEKAKRQFDPVLICWLVPKKGILADQEGKKWVSPLLAMARHTTPGDSPIIKGDEPPDLEKLEVLPAWFFWARSRWSRFARKVRDGKEPLGKAAAALEGELNSPWVFRKAREKAGFSTEMESSSGDNALKKAEACRQVNLLCRSRRQGRARRPHVSHKGVLCPFQTPESKVIGLHLFRSVNTEYKLSERALRSRGKNLGKDKFLFSLATGLIPYPHHTDGPRLLMGGKNLKQAEPGIRGAEEPMVPGYLEGFRENSLLEGDLKPLFRNYRFSPPLGTNAVVAIMPYAGFTFQDGIVISEDFSRKLAMEGHQRTQSETFREILLPGEISSGLCDDLLNAEFTSLANGKTLFSYDAPLPLPPSISKFFPYLPRYRFRYPGKLVRATVKTQRQRPRKEEGNKTNLTVALSYVYECDIPMGLGDKLTGRHGNKGVVTRILSPKETPMVSFGGKTVPVDLILSPCSVIGRKNLGQIWEMLHGLGLRAIEMGLIKTRLFNRNEELTFEEIEEQLFPLFREKLGMDEHGSFTVTFPETGRTVQAFAGLQYFTRLHHHSLDKLQARGTLGPVTKFLDQPSVAGLKTAQCLGEMENWSILGYPPPENGERPESFLLELRSRQNPEQLRKMACGCLHMLGHRLDTAADLPRVERKDLQKAYSDLLKLDQKGNPNLDLVWEIGGEGTAQPGLRDLPEVLVQAFRALSKPVEGFKISEEARKNLLAVLDREKGTPAKKIREIRGLEENESGKPLPDHWSVRETGTDENFPGRARKRSVSGPGILALLNLEGGGLSVWPEIVLRDDKLGRSLRYFLSCAKQFGKGAADSKKNPEDWFNFLYLLQCYRDRLENLVLGKMGLVRRQMVRHRLANSGRAVIIPAPGLRPDEIYLPREMLETIVPGDLSRHLEEASSTWEESGLSKAELQDNALKAAPAWCLALRQPSLHRHSVQAFRARCWEKPVIGLPPFVTAGFNADFDGDTMAVLFPDGNPDLHHLCIVCNPGLVGTGAPAMETGYDLALGWGALGEKGRSTLVDEFRKVGLTLKDEKEFREAGTLRDSMARLLDGQGKAGDALAESLRIFQQRLCEASTGSFTFPPLELQDLHHALAPNREDPKSGNQSDVDKAGVDKALHSAFQKEGSIHALVRLKAKGGPAEINVMCGALREPQVYHDDETEEAFIFGNLWKGLDNEELFMASYSARDSMASKKLAVAEAGYLSRLLAEGLYETSVTKDNCGTTEGITVSYSQNLGLMLSPPETLREFQFPLFDPASANNPEKLFDDLARIAWGRVPVGCREGLQNEDLRQILRFWFDKCGLEEVSGKVRENLGRNRGRLVLRSPLSCAEEGEGVCSLCMGADPSRRPFNEGLPVPVGTRVGLTAAQAIGERGTQLAMKRFHTNTSSKPVDIDSLKALLIKRPKGSTGSTERAERFGAFLKCLSANPDDGRQANQDLPQLLVHFELALRAERGLEDLAADPNRGALALLSSGGVCAREVLLGPVDLTAGKSLKSRVVWGDEG